MSRARTLAGAIGSDGALNVADVAGLAAVASSGSASDLTTGTLPNARLATGAAVANLGYTPVNKAGDTASKPIKYSSCNDITGTDLNTVTTGGIYMGYNLNGSNHGPAAAGWAMIEVFTNGSDQIFQVYQEAGYDGGRRYTRFSVNGGAAWGGWIQTATPGQLTTDWFSASAAVLRYRGGVDASSQNSNNGSIVNAISGASNEGWWTIGLVGHSEGLEVKHMRASCGTVHWWHSYGSKPAYRNKTDDTYWNAWNYL